MYFIIQTQKYQEFYYTFKLITIKKKINSKLSDKVFRDVLLFIKLKESIELIEFLFYLKIIRKRTNKNS